MARFERDEYEGARERFRSLMRRANMFFMPVAVFIFALSGTLLVALFGKSSELADKLMMMGSILIYLSAFAIVFSWLINHMGKSTVTMLNVGVGWGVHIVSLIIFMIVLKMGAYGLVLSAIVPLVVYDVMCLLEVSKALSNRQEFIRSFVLPVVSSAVAGFIAFLLNRLLVNLIGDVLTLIVCAVIFWFTYMLAMIASRGIRAHELYRIPFGSLFLGIAAMIQSEENIGE
jgi:O-antigen/teichoic acid export membrane protein